MTDSEREFRIRPGKQRSTRAPQAKSFVNQVLRAAQKAGHTSSPGSSRSSGRSSGSAPSTFGRGHSKFGRSRLFASNRRVIVKARIARHKGRAFRAAPIAAHLAYLKREGVSRDSERGIMFDAETDRADDLGFARRCEGDRHHFRFIVSPEDAADMEDLKGFTRDLVKQIEADLGTKLDWVAVDHWNTDNPHVHLLVRGVDETGADLVISRDYISRGLASRARDLVDLELGPKPEHEIRNALEREVTAERWTRLDREITRQANELGYIDLRPEVKGPDDPEIRRLMIARLRHLEKAGLAADAGINEWFVEPGTERTLRDLGTRGDIIKTMHRPFAERGSERGAADFVIDAAREGPPIIGRLVDKELHDELTGEAYAVIDGTDGRAHHVRLRGIEAFAHAPDIGGIVEVRRFGGPDDPRPTLILANRSHLDLNEQITAPGATWLDHRLVEREPMPLAAGGFGKEVREAMDARAGHLADEGLARREGQRIVLQRNLLSTLRRRELDAVGAELSAETGTPHVKAQAGEYVAGTYSRQITLTSGRFAVIEGRGPDGALGFQLVPWSREIDDKLGQLREWLKTLRKKNASVIFATQSLSDIDNSSIAPAIIESCLTRLLLPNERAIEPQITTIYRRFGLNDRQIEILARATPKQDYYCQSRRGNRLFDLGLSEVGLALCAASSKSDQGLITDILAEHGRAGFLDAWLRARGVDWAADLIPNLTNIDTAREREREAAPTPTTPAPTVFDDEFAFELDLTEQEIEL